MKEKYDIMLVIDGGNEKPGGHLFTYDSDIVPVVEDIIMIAETKAVVVRTRVLGVNSNARPVLLCDSVNIAPIAGGHS